ncbi:MAG: recombination-associated protein RdgC [Pseudomonadales bacterium]
MFRNLRLYRLHSNWPESEEALAEQLEQVAFKPCGPFSERSSGWEPPAAPEYPVFCRRVGGADLLKLRSQVRLLPAAAVNEALEERIAELQARTQREPSRREKRDLKDEVHAELMPRALLKSERIRGFCLLADKLIGIDTASEAQAERFLDQLREALGSLQVTPLKYQQPMGQLISQVFLGKGPSALRAGRECRMQDASVGAATVSWADIDLSDDDVQRHVHNGLKLARLGMVFEDLASFVVDQDGIIRKLKLQGLDGADDIGDEDPLARLDAEFVLTTGVAQRLVEAFRKALGGFE